jgi:hypothetical protein
MAVSQITPSFIYLTFQRFKLFYSSNNLEDWNQLFDVSRAGSIHVTSGAEVQR